MAEGGTKVYLRKFRKILQNGKLSPLKQWLIYPGDGAGVTRFIHRSVFV